MMEEVAQNLNFYRNKFLLDDLTFKSASSCLEECLPRVQDLIKCKTDYHILTRCAILIASRKEIYETIEGKKIRGSNLSLTQFVKESPPIQISNFTTFLKNFMMKLPQLDLEITKQITEIIEKFQFSLKMYNKFRQLFKKLGIRSIREQEISSDQKIQNIYQLGWYLFSYSRRSLLQHESNVIESAGLIVSVLCLIIRSLPPDLVCQFNNDRGKGNQLEDRLLNELSGQNSSLQLKRYQTAILELLNYHIPDLVVQSKNGNNCLSTASDCGSSNPSVSYCQNSQDYDMMLTLNLDYDYISVNNNNLSSLYQKTMTNNDFDDRYFINSQSQKIQAPHKYMPFMRQGLANKVKTPIPSQKIRILTSMTPQSGKSPIWSQKNSKISQSQKQEASSVASTPTVNGGWYNNLKMRRNGANRPPKIPSSACKRIDFRQTPKSTPTRSTFSNKLTNSSPASHQTPKIIYTPKNLRQINLPKQAISSPYITARNTGMTPTAAAQLQATPMTVAMHIHSWLLTCVNKIHKGQQNLNTPASKSSRSPYTGLTLTQKLDRFSNVLSLSQTQEFGRNLNHLVKILGGTINLPILAKNKLAGSGSDQTIRRMQEHTARHQMTQMHCLILHYFQNIMDAQKFTGANLSVLFKNQIFLKSVAITAAETVLFVHNIINVRFEHLLKVSQLHAFDYWCTINYIIKTQSSMPQSLAYHFVEIESCIVLQWAWEKDSPLVNAITEAKSKSQVIIDQVVRNHHHNQNNKTNRDDDVILQKNVQSHEVGVQELQNIGREQINFENQENIEPSGGKNELVSLRFKVMNDKSFFNKVIEFASNRVSFITEQLEISQYQKECIWETVKFAFSQSTELLFNRHVDQIILCSIYVTSKLLSKKYSYQLNYGDSKPIIKSISFHRIIQKQESIIPNPFSRYKQLNQYILHQITKIIQVIDMNDYSKDLQQTNHTADIICFYNRVFIQSIKQFACSQLELILKRLITQPGSLPPPPPPRSRSVSLSIETLAPPNPLKQCADMLKSNYDKYFQHSRRDYSPSIHQSSFNQHTFTPRTNQLFAGMNQTPLYKYFSTPKSGADDNLSRTSQGWKYDMKKNNNMMKNIAEMQEEEDDQNDNINQGRDDNDIQKGFDNEQDNKVVQETTRVQLIDNDENGDNIDIQDQQNEDDDDDDNYNFQSISPIGIKQKFPGQNNNIVSNTLENLKNYGKNQTSSFEDIGPVASNNQLKKAQPVSSIKLFGATLMKKGHNSMGQKSQNTNHQV